MGEGGEKKGEWVRRHFPSLTRQTLVRHYIPMAGGLSHGLFSVQILTPSFLRSITTTYDLALTNALFFNAHIGVGVYVYYRSHMHKVSQRTRVMYSVYTAALLNFGSVLLWATTKTILPSNPWIRGAFGLLTSFCILSIGHDYLGYIDHLADKALANDNLVQQKD